MFSCYRASSEDTLSLNSYNSDSPSQEPPLAPPHATNLPYSTNGTAQSSQARSHVQVPVWDQYTGRRVGSELRDVQRRGKRKYHVRQASADFEGDIQEVIQANHLEIMAMNQDGYQDGDGGYSEGGSRGEGQRLVEYDNLFGGREFVRMPTQRQVRKLWEAENWFCDDLTHWRQFEFTITCFCHRPSLSIHTRD